MDLLEHTDLTDLTVLLGYFTCVTDPQRSPRPIEHDRYRALTGHHAMESMADPSGQAARLPLVDPDAAPPAVEEALAILPAINLFRATANATSLYPNYIHYVNLLFKQLDLDSGLESMIVLHVVRQSGCLYAWRQNVVAKSVGVSDTQVAALEIGMTVASCFDEPPADRVPLHG